MNAPPVDVLQSIFGRWPEMVGEEVARHTRPASLDGSRLVVACDTSAWASELRWLESQLLERIAEVTGSSRVTALSVRVDRPS